MTDVPIMEITCAEAVGRMEVLPSYLCNCKSKPLWFHRLMMRLFLGWK